ncbi:MAG: hypothetical protein AAGJ70_11955, partial [Pseudomonadota bacterium]
GFIGVEAQGVEHRIKMTRRAGAALHGETCRLVDGDDMIIAEQYAFAQFVTLCAAQRVGFFFSALPGARARFIHPVFRQRRHAHGLALLKPRARFDARTVDTHLSRPQQFLQLAETQRRVVLAEPAIETKAIVGGDHITLDDAGHLRLSIIAARPDA